MNNSDKVTLHPIFTGTSTESFAHSLLAKILRFAKLFPSLGLYVWMFSETNRAEAAKQELTYSIQANPLLWSSIKNLCDNRREDDASLFEVFPKSLKDMLRNNKQKRLMERKTERQR